MQDGKALIAVFVEDVCWVTQVVVHRNFRGFGIATRLLNKLKTDSDALFGIISSHPAALVALSSVASGSSIRYWLLIASIAPSHFLLLKWAKRLQSSS